MLRRIILIVCLASVAQVIAPMQGNASVSISTLYGNADHLPKHVINALLKTAAAHWEITYQEALYAYRNWDLLITETSSPSGKRAVFIDYDGGCLLEIIQDML